MTYYLPVEKLKYSLFLNLSAFENHTLNLSEFKNKQLGDGSASTAHLIKWEMDSYWAGEVQLNWQFSGRISSLVT
jgi:hypothetical protein